MNTQFKVICPDTIRKSMMHDDDMIKQFVDLYLIQCPIDLLSLSKSINSKDPKVISSAAHHIKPTMEYIGAKKLKNNFQQLENLGATNAPYSDLQEKFIEIESEFTLMLNELKSFKEAL